MPTGTNVFLIGQGAGDITPEVGVTGTPVIDPSTNTLYVVSKSVVVSGPTFFQRLHAIDLASGNEKFAGPVGISASVSGNAPDAVGGQVTFSVQTQNQRPSLALVNGVVYIGSSRPYVYALNAGNGALLWSYKTGAFVASSPAVAGPGGA